MKTFVQFLNDRREERIELTQTEVKTETMEYLRREITTHIDEDFDLGSQGV